MKTFKLIKYESNWANAGTLSSDSKIGLHWCRINFMKITIEFHVDEMSDNGASTVKIFFSTSNRRYSSTTACFRIRMLPNQIPINRIESICHYLPITSYNRCLHPGTSCIPTSAAKVDLSSIHLMKVWNLTVKIVIIGKATTFNWTFNNVAIARIELKFCTG